jgi:2-deoxy-D-gluconate 3-dehydrogenase
VLGREGIAASLNDLFDITDKKIIVTGGSGDLGRGMAEALLDAGAEVAIIDVSDRIFQVCGISAKNFR